MAKKSAKAKNNKRAKLIKKFRAKRTALKATVKDMSLSFEERMDAQRTLQELPVDSSPTRYRTRCVVSGRPRGVLSKFGLCMAQLRKYAMRGEVPGLVKSSW